MVRVLLAKRFAANKNHWVFGTIQFLINYFPKESAVELPRQYLLTRDRLKTLLHIVSELHGDKTQELGEAVMLSFA